MQMSISDLLTQGTIAAPWKMRPQNTLNGMRIRLQGLYLTSTAKWLSDV